MTSWRQLAKFWFKLLGLVVRHWSSEGYEETYCWMCPICKVELKKEAMRDELAYLDSKLVTPKKE